MKEYLERRLLLVSEPRASELGLEYADSVLITCAVLSACAADRWPGTGIDRARFIELLVKHSPDHFHASWVSIPELLYQRLILQSQTPYGEFGNRDNIYRGEDVDCSLDEATKRFPDVTDLRKRCYASLIYERLRCAYAHEYLIGENMNAVPATRRQARVSYIRRGPEADTRIRISFHIDYLIQLAEHHVSCLTGNPLQRPSTWWICQ